MRLTLVVLLSACAVAPSSTTCLESWRRQPTPAEAQAVLDGFIKANEADTPIEPLRSPKSLDDVLEILRRDQLDLFPKGIAFASQDQTPRGRVLTAQLELAQGEAMLMVARILERQVSQAAVASIDLRAKAALGLSAVTEQSSTSALSDQIRRGRNVIDAMWLMAPIHIERGARLANQLIAQLPDDYHGYRVAADYYRMRQDWVRFDRMYAEAQKKHPESTGLHFLAGLALVDRWNERQAGGDQLREALKLDPHFAKAQAALLLLASDVVAQHVELSRLRSINPQHHLVQLAGPSIEAEYQAFMSAQGQSRQGGGAI